MNDEMIIEGLGLDVGVAKLRAVRRLLKHPVGVALLEELEDYVGYNTPCFRAVDQRVAFDALRAAHADGARMVVCWLKGFLAADIEEGEDD